ncbi:MAG: FdrA family protein [Firmicutes bacterium HGW-Firmicutes-10]|jgi:succinyl-CoA synthetase alpha subunit|nr:MAG: FdrA family protein [Firmicutes bacterium HGW-Firmicutes-10]
MIHNIIKHNAYFDSVTLMLFSSKLGGISGVQEAAVMMGTDHNIELMKSSGILTEELASKVSANDLVIGIKAVSQEVIDLAIKTLDEQFENKNKSSDDSSKIKVKTIDAAVKKMDGLNFAIVSLPGRFAAAETMKCLKNGMHVLLFSDNITIDEENELKDYAVENNLLMMGPDCGTAIINGVALGFANVVRKGNIGLVAASGTGLQELTVIIDKLGGGISQALGTGGRDLKKDIGGKMMLLALDALANDPETQVIGIVSKPPAKEVMVKILDKVKTIAKPVVACFLGGDPSLVEGTDTIATETIEEAAKQLVKLSKGELTTDLQLYSEEELNGLVESEVSKLQGQKYLRGLYTGGTLAYEGMLILDAKVGDIYSNIAMNKEFGLKDVEVSLENTVLDMGDDYFTDGMPHPMIEPKLRSERIKKEASDPETAVILLDCVLGYGSHEDPAGAVSAAVQQAKELQSNRHVTYIASVCGTEKDPQVLSDQVEKLKNAGIIVLPTNAQAAQLAARILERL